MGFEAKNLTRFHIALIVLKLVVFFGNVGNSTGVSVEEDLSLTTKEKMALDKFKPRMIPHLTHDYMKTDIYLIRWLRARNLNVQQAEQMLMENLRWRKVNRMDTILSEDWSDMKDEFPLTIDTFDKNGRPVCIANLGRWDFRNAVLTGRINRMLRYTYKLLEEVTLQVIQLQKLGKPVTQWKAVYNLDGFNYFQHACPRCLAGFASFVSAYEEYYPGFADEIIFINAPPGFQVVMEAVRGLFSPATRKIVKVFGTDKKVWREYLGRQISVEQRRAEFGGIRED